MMMGIEDDNSSDDSIINIDESIKEKMRNDNLMAVTTK